MPSFFTFQQGSESRACASTHTDSSPLLGRFRAVPDTNRSAQRNSILGLDSLGVFGNVWDDGDDGGDEGEDEAEGGKAARWWRRRRRALRDTWLEPKSAAVGRVLERWLTRWMVLAVFPALMVVAWCALPFPKYDLPDDEDGDFNGIPIPDWNATGHRIPGHGEARVEVNFWFYTFVYYGLYNLAALMWVTKVFNIYSLNWWPQSLGLPFTVSCIAIISIAGPVPIYYSPELNYITRHNTAWICWTFFTMSMPLIIAFLVLLNHERHLGRRVQLSETQRIFTSSWWTEETDTIMARTKGRRARIQQGTFDPLFSSEGGASLAETAPRTDLSLRKRWLPASFVRFLWFCAALFIGMMAYVLGEAYAEIYLRTLPHSTYDTIAYVYSWVITVHLLDGLTGFILGGNEGERVGSYPLGWIFKLYYSLTYQTYVRALYARLRSPQQFILLQVLSSGFLIILAPIQISQPFHYLLSILSLNGQSYSTYQKFVTRTIFIRSLAENVSMLTFLGSILVLHYGPNREVYPYFAFDNARESNDDGYDFTLTFYASAVTWTCEIIAGWIVRRIIWFGWSMDVSGEAVADLKRWPELLPTSAVVCLHVGQNMLFEIVRLRFH